MKVVINIEANGLDPTEIWWIVCKDIDTGAIHAFRHPTQDTRSKDAFIVFAGGVTKWIGHNIQGYDLGVLRRLLGVSLPSSWPVVCDTLIISKMVNYGREGHSTDQYAKEFGINKPKQPPFQHFSEELGGYCELLVNITEKIYDKYKRYINNPNYADAIYREHRFQLVVNGLHSAGFKFNERRAADLLVAVEAELAELDKDILDAFPPREVLLRSFTPTVTKHGTISRTSVPRALHGEIHKYEVGQTYRHTRLETFNPASHKQLIEVLHNAGWRPTDKTKTHVETLRELNRLKRLKRVGQSVDAEVQKVHNDLCKLEKYGWKINETNLGTLPPSAPTPSRLLAKRILLEARRRSLTEWLTLVREDGRIHGDFYGIGAWTHRMAHQKPNTANIPTPLKSLGKEMRSLWCAPRNRLLVGVDAEGIQLRIFAHYINDPDFTRALVEGKKELGTDPHSLNKTIIGEACRKGRAGAKNFIYAYLLGGGIDKLAFLLGCSSEEAKEALAKLEKRYEGLQELKQTIIPADAKRGWFTGIDGRPVRIPGEDVGTRRHLAMSGYLQNGEAIVVKETVLKTLDKIAEEKLNAILVNVVHDEVIFEVPNDVRKAEHISALFCQSIVEVGEQFKLRCPLAGDGHVGLNWYEIH